MKLRLHQRTTALRPVSPLLLLCGLLVACFLALAPSARAQQRPYIGYAYPAGGQKGTTFQLRLGGQAVDDATGVTVSGEGVTAKIVECYRRLNNQEMQLLNEQLRALRRETLSDSSKAMLMDSEAPVMMSETSTNETAAQPNAQAKTGHVREMMKRIEKRTLEYVPNPACASIASLVIVEVVVSSEAAAGDREIRLLTARGISNPLVFHVGELPEHTRKPMLSATQQVLGKEAQALRKRPPEESEDTVTLPCTLNGQIASGEINRYRFEARKGQRLVISAKARQLIPYIADAVPGWFQPVMVLYDGAGKEVAYDDDYRFKPDPTILYQVPADGEYVLAINDAIYRGREDFVYRVSVGETPFVTSFFPLGARTNEPVEIKIAGWNLGSATVKPPPPGTLPGTYSLTGTNRGRVSNPLPFALDTFPDMAEKEPNDTMAKAQPVTLPIVVNGRIDRPGDQDVFRFSGKSNEMVVAEVMARRLDSPVDSILKLTDAKGQVLAFNDDCEDLGAGINTHHADSYLMSRLPADGTYFVHLGDTARKGGEEFAYRLRMGPPQPDFALRVVPSSASLRSKGNATLSVYALRKDGFAAPIKLTLKDPPKGFSATPVTLGATQAVARFSFKTDLQSTPEPVNLSIVGTAKIDGQEITHEAVPAEDRMQAFFWRHLVPAADLKVLVFDPNYQPPAKRVAPPRPIGPKLEVASTTTTNRPAFTKQQVAGRLRQLKFLFEENLLTDQFYDEKVTECEAAQ